MVAVDEQLGGGAFQVRARVGDDPVGCAGTGRIAKVRDDRMRADRRIDPRVTEGQKERVLRVEYGDARRDLTAESGSEQVGFVTRQQRRACLAEVAWPGAEPYADSSERAAGERAAAMRSRDEHNTAHLRNRLVAEHLTQELAVSGRTGDFVDGSRADRLPETRSAALNHHLRQDAAQAVTDDDNPVKSRVRAVGIELLTSPPQ